MAQTAKLGWVAILAVAGSSLAMAGAQDTVPAAESISPAPAPAAAGSAVANPIVAAPGAPKPATTTPPPPPRRARAISPEVAAQLAAAAPRFTPPPPKPATPTEEEEVDARDVDKPKNEIIRLPKYIVREPAPPVFSERAINTKSGLEALAMKRYVGEGYRALNRFTLPLFGSSMESYAMLRYEEDERLKNMSDLRDQAGLVSARDRAAGAYVRKQSAEATMHQPDFDWRPIGR